MVFNEELGKEIYLGKLLICHIVVSLWILDFHIVMLDFFCCLM